MKVKSESEVAQSCLTLSHPMDCSLLGSSVHGIFQARVLEWGAIAFSILPRVKAKSNTEAGKLEDYPGICSFCCVQSCLKNARDKSKGHNQCHEGALSVIWKNVNTKMKVLLDYNALNNTGSYKPTVAILFQLLCRA